MRLVVAAALATVVAATLRADAVVDRVIDGPLTVREREVSFYVLSRIAEHAKVPVGFEAYPSNGEPESLPLEEQKVLTGRTVTEALHWLTELDKRYHWLESRGVIVVRPVEAWGDKQHFLNKMVHDVKFEERDPMDLVHALSELYRRDEFAVPVIPWPVWVPLTFTLPHGSVLDLLNEAARVGDLCWEVTYSLDPPPNRGPVSIMLQSRDRNRRGGGGFYPPVPLPRWLAR